ncbi:ParB/RepB/Spo0J family partition protein [Xanthomonas perforans]|nr:ParB/RepB/Spo0J family partition protein [Xanthomonas perforans]MBZ2461340.1 ParB/RepB/Spo0J family partition protein [Xanthomonas perforans]MBZ2482766.1 ParB/RepB/Spo0J family partition protein [Xanthomonas perforans]MBZ2491334.1 ParB/RepB/Spo0J family partition protein [Xanthomonas perforans]MBZ2495777.1 ParB/RepB/Spo0J family partition protein [Xanthomonas perforans]
MNNKFDLSGLDGFSNLLQAGSDAASAAGKPLSLPLDRVAENPRNARKRYNPTKLQELADSIRAGGLSTPIVVKIHPDDPKRYQIVHGHRRYRAHQLIQATAIEAVVTDKQGAASQLVDNLQREDLTTAELIDGIRDLLTDGFKQAEIAEQLGKSKAWVSKRAALAELPETAPELQALLDADRVRDASTLYEALQCYKQDADAVRAFLASAGERQIVQADIEALRAAMRRDQRPPSPATTDIDQGVDQDERGTSDQAGPAVFSMGENGEGGYNDAPTGEGANDDGREQSAPLASDLSNGTGSVEPKIDDDNNDEGSERKQNVKPTAAATIDPMKVRKPLVQVRVGRREGVMLIAKKAEHGLAWVQFENGEEELLDVNKVKLVAITDAAK